METAQLAQYKTEITEADKTASQISIMMQMQDHLIAMNVRWKIQLERSIVPSVEPLLVVKQLITIQNTTTLPR